MSSRLWRPARELVLVGLTVLGACAGPTAATVTHGSPKTLRPESLIGATSGAIYALLGKPDLVRRDQDVEVLQYPAETCALLIYLYQPEGGGEPKTAFIDARNKQAGPASPQACLAEALNIRSAQR